MIKRTALFLLVFCLATAALGAAALAKKLSAYGFVARSGGVTLVADVDLARYRGGEKFLPVWIWLGHDEAKVLHAGRGAFTLVDPKGEKHALPDAGEVRSTYTPSLIGLDYTYLDRLEPYGDMVYLQCQRIPRVAYFPSPTGPPHILYDTVELPNRTFFRALLYFPNPAGAAEGTYTLIYDDTQSGVKIELPFAVSWAR